MLYGVNLDLPGPDYRLHDSTGKTRYTELCFQTVKVTVLSAKKFHVNTIKQNIVISLPLTFQLY